MAQNSIVLKVQVKCCNQRHSILLMQSGALAFPDHARGFMAERVLTTLTKKRSCHCLSILEAWRAWQAGWPPFELERILPKALAKQAALAKDRGTKRRIKRQSSATG